MPAIQPTGQDTLIAYAAAPGQEAADGRGRNSPSPKRLLQHMPEPGVEVSVMLKQVAAEVRRETHGEQRPQQLSDMSRTFYFAKAEPAVRQDGGSCRGAGAEPAPDHSIELAYWNSARSVNDCASVRAYLDRFPNGIFVDLAKLSERRLCEPTRKVTVTDASLQPQSPPARLGVEGSNGIRGSRLRAFRPKRRSLPSLRRLPEAKSPSPDEVKTAALSPDRYRRLRSLRTSPRVIGSDLARELQAELDRVGCSAGNPDGIWGSHSATAVREFSRHAGVKLDADAPSEKALSAVKRHRKRVCPVVADGRITTAASIRAAGSQPVPPGAALAIPGVLT